MLVGGLFTVPKCELTDNGVLKGRVWTDGELRGWVVFAASERVSDLALSTSAASH